MAKPTIITRASKGSALTWTEGDTNLTNLRDATIGITDGTTSGTLDLNDTLTFTAGTNVTLSYNSTSKALTINASGGAGGGLANVVEDTTPQLGGDLDTNGYSIIGTSNIVEFGALNTSTYLSSNGSGDLIIAANAFAGTGSTLTFNATNGDVTFFPYSTGKIKLPRIYYTEPIYDLGTTGGTIAPNVTNGTVQKITLNSALTINAFTSAVAGQSLTLIIYGGAAYTTITSTMKFAGGSKTLTGTAGCIDILSIYYDGTTYFASINKGFA